MLESDVSSLHSRDQCVAPIYSEAVCRPSVLERTVQSLYSRILYYPFMLESGTLCVVSKVACRPSIFASSTPPLHTRERPVVYPCLRALRRPSVLKSSMKSLYYGGNFTENLAFEIWASFLSVQKEVFESEQPPYLQVLLQYHRCWSISDSGNGAELGGRVSRIVPWLAASKFVQGSPHSVSFSISADAAFRNAGLEQWFSRPRAARSSLWP